MLLPPRQRDVLIAIQKVIWRRIVRKAYSLPLVTIAVKQGILANYAQLLAPELVLFAKVLVMSQRNALNYLFEPVIIVVIMVI